MMLTGSPSPNVLKRLEQHEQQVGYGSLGPSSTALGPSSYSIKGEFARSTVLITGASGYIGSVVLEQLLRTTDVGRVYLLLRPRRGQGIQERADKILQGPLFHKVRDNAALVKKVHVVGGDISLPGLGLSAADRATLVSSVNYIIHCAADIRLEADIQETLTSNYEGTRSVLQLAASVQCLRCLVHVSSAFINMNMPRGSVIDEAVYPLRLGRQVVDVEHIAKELLDSPNADANQRAETYKQLWNFPNTYTMGKHLSEQLVTRYQAQLQLPVAIVRPSLVSAIAGEPYPGYVGNWAGPIGACAAMAIGLYDTLHSVASQPTGVWDIVPADMVASSILAAAAAVSAGTAAAISQGAQSGVVTGTEADCRIVLGYPHPLAASARHAALVHGQGSQGNPTIHSTQTPTHKATSTAVTQLQTKGHTTDDTAGMANCPDAHPQVDQHCGNSAGTGINSPQLFTGTALNCSDNSGTSSSSVCSSDTQQPAGCCMPLLIVHSATSSTYPLVLMEGWNFVLDFLEAHKPPFSMAWRGLPRMTADFEPSVANVMSARRRTGWKVWALACLMRLLGKDKAARKLEAGFETFCVQNNAKTDRQLVFATDTLVALDAALNSAEAAEYMLVWRPIANRAAPNNTCMPSSGKAAAPAAAGTAAAAAAAVSEGHLAPVKGDLTWRRYFNTQMAGIYRALYGAEVPQQQLTAAAAAAAAALARGKKLVLSDEHYIQHDFVRIK